MTDNSTLNKILDNIEDFDEYIKHHEGIFRATIQKENLSIDFKNTHSNKIRNLIVIKSNYMKDKNDTNIKYKLFNEEGHQIENPALYDDLKIEEIRQLMNNYKTPLERTFDVRKIDNFFSIERIYYTDARYNFYKSDYDFYKKDVQFYGNNYFYILEYKDYLIKKDKKNIVETEYYKNLKKVNSIPEDILNLLKDNLEYIVGFGKDSDIIDFKDNQLIKYDVFVNSLKQTYVYKNAEIKASKQKTIDRRILFAELGTFSIFIYLFYAMGISLFSYLAFAIFGIILVTIVLRIDGYGEIFRSISHKESKILDVGSNIRIMDCKYISLNENERSLEMYKMSDKIHLIKTPVKEEIKQITVSTNKEDNKIKIIKTNNKEMEEEIKIINKYIEEINENELLDTKNQINTYYIPEINKNLKNYIDLNDEYKDLLMENIELLKHELEDILNNKKKENTMQTEVGIKVMNRELKASR